MDTFDILFIAEHVTFHKDGALILLLFSIKNYTARTGFEIRIPPGSQPLVDPVACLHCYIARAEGNRPDIRPVFPCLEDTRQKFMLQWS